MQLSPRYGDEPVLRMPSLIDDPATPLLRQRRRLAERLAVLDDHQWAVSSRCAGWSVQDVATHLITTNQFWALSVRAGRQGAPTRYLDGFDPVATPAQLVEGSPDSTPAQTLEQLIASNEALADALADLDDAGWSSPAEAPPGHLSLRLVALHALWDGWIHERDIALPLGLPLVDEPDEVIGALAYVAALGPAFLALRGSTRAATLEVRATDPEARVVIELGPTVEVHGGPAHGAAVVLAGDAVELVEALSFRAPLLVELADRDRWVLGDLGAVFDQPIRS